MVDPSGKQVTLKGTNLGNWFVIEPWMLQLTEGEEAIRDQFEMESILAARFGDAERERLMDRYRRNWMVERDWDIIRSFGFNLIRLPMNYRLFEDDANPMQLREDAFEWIDHAIDAAERIGCYTILDMHGTQGGQSLYDHTGHAGQNKLWSVPKNQERLAWLWGEIAKRYRDRSAVLAYDVFNEPYGGSKDQQVAVFRKCLEAIRKHDPDKLVFAHGNWDDYRHYGNPADNGWRNVGFQMHYYPGLFGGGEPTIGTHARHLRNLEAVAEHIRSWNVPFLVGEMNVVFDAAGGPAMMRRTFDLHTQFGWMTTMWSYKVASRTGGVGNATWGMATTRNPARRINLRKASLNEIETWIDGFASEPLEVHVRLRDAFTAATPPPIDLPKLPPLITKAPAVDALAGWEQADIGGPLPGGLQRGAGNRFTLFGGGSDIWAFRDEFRFLYRRTSTDFDLEVTVRDVPELDGFSKAGLMVRGGLEPDAAAILLSVFPNGDLQIAVRSEKGGAMQGVGSAEGTLPVTLRFQRRGSRVTVSAERSGNVALTRELTFAPSDMLAGAVALSHNPATLIAIEYENLTWTPR